MAREDGDLHFFYDNSKFPENESHSDKRETGYLIKYQEVIYNFKHNIFQEAYPRRPIQG